MDRSFFRSLLYASLLLLLLAASLRTLRGIRNDIDLDTRIEFEDDEGVRSRRAQRAYWWS